MAKPRILIVEDETIIALDLQNRLTHLGYEVLATGFTGPEAIELADQLRPDLVFMDIGLDDTMDGLRAAQEIRRQSGIPVIFLTAYTDDSTQQKVEALASVFLAKPFSNEDLSNAINVTLGRGK